MRSVTFSMGVSLDGYIVGPDGGFDWTAPDAQVFRFWIDEIRDVGVHLLEIALTGVEVDRRRDRVTGTRSGRFTFAADQSGSPSSRSVVATSPRPT